MTENWWPSSARLDSRVSSRPLGTQAGGLKVDAAVLQLGQPDHHHQPVPVSLASRLDAAERDVHRQRGEEKTDEAANAG